MIDFRRLLLIPVAFALCPCLLCAETDPWNPQQATDWYAKQPWPVGCNYIPSTAINELEMWQADTFDLPTIDRELGWAEQLGFNTVRVFLHNLPWKDDSKGFIQRIDEFLTVADRHHIRPMFVLLDSVWDPNPRSGKQPEPRPGLHNSGWVQAPGREVLMDRSRWGEVQDYVNRIVGHFKNDKRILAWDVFNEPDNMNQNSYGKDEPPGKVLNARELLVNVFQWCREAEATQPLTSGLWIGTWGDPEKLSSMEQVQLNHSDVISFHNYSPLPEMKEAVDHLKRYHRPLFCTEYMARPRGSTFQTILPYLKEQKVAAYNWGFVNGKSQTIYPWDSWQHRYASEPAVWFHDILRTNGTPFDVKEVELIKQITGAVQPALRR